MTDIQRFNSDGFDSEDGVFVLYTDHLEALRQAEQRGRERSVAGAQVLPVVTVPADYIPPDATLPADLLSDYEQGQRDAIAKVRVRRDEFLEQIAARPVNTKSLAGAIYEDAIAAIKGES